MIEYDDVSPMLTMSCPSFASKWADIQAEAFDTETEILPYLVAGDFARHLGALYRVGQTEEFPAVFELIERLHVEGSPAVQELATIGFLEDLQNAGLTECDPNVFVDWLLPESAYWWKQVEAFWNRATPRYVRATIDDVAVLRADDRSDAQ